MLHLDVIGTRPHQRCRLICILLRFGLHAAERDESLWDFAFFLDLEVVSSRPHDGVLLGLAIEFISSEDEGH